MGQATKWTYDAIEVTENQAARNGGADFDVAWKRVDSVKATLNRVGQEGWELVSVVPMADLNGTTRKVVLFLKRMSV